MQFGSILKPFDRNIFFKSDEGKKLMRIQNEIEINR